jgi:hypothetical protein
MVLTEYICPRCGSSEVFYSRRRNFTEKWILRLALLRPFRCAECFERYYRSVFIQAREPRERKAVPSTVVPPHPMDRVA